MDEENTNEETSLLRSMWDVVRLNNEATISGQKVIIETMQENRALLRLAQKQENLLNKLVHGEPLSHFDYELKFLREELKRLEK